MSPSTSYRRLQVPPVIRSVDNARKLIEINLKKDNCFYELHADGSVSLDLDFEMQYGNRLLIPAKINTNNVPLNLHMNFLNPTFHFLTSPYRLTTTVRYPRINLFVKSTFSYQYLLHTSCHPSHLKKSITFSLALRIRRICSTTEKFQQRTNELLEFLCKRGHKPQYVQSQINKAFQIPHGDTVYYKSKTRNND